MTWLQQRPLAWLGWRGTVIRRGYFRLPEWIGISAFILCLVAVLMGYQNLVAPLSQQLSSISRETSDLRRQTETARIERQQLEREAGAFAEAMENWRRFERERLRDTRTGQLALIDEINALARKYQVKLTDTISFDLTDQSETKPGATPTGRRGNQRIQSYPSFDVKFGIAGDYRNIRRFVNNLEQSRQFILLELLSLSPEGMETKPGGALDLAAAGTPTSTLGDIAVTLTLTAYFRHDRSETVADPSTARRVSQGATVQPVRQ